MERWVVAAKRADFQEIGRKFSIDPVIARLIRNRDVIGEDAIRMYLYGGLESLSDPGKMKGMEEAADLLLESRSALSAIMILTASCLPTY